MGNSSMNIKKKKKKLYTKLIFKNLLSKNMNKYLIKKSQVVQKESQVMLCP